MRSRSIRYGVPLDRLVVPPCGRAYFLLLRQKKVAKEKAPPGSAPAARVPCATRNRRGLRNSGLRPSDSPRPLSAAFCVAQRLPGGPGKASRNDGSAQEEKKKSLIFYGRPLETAQNHSHRFGGDAFRVPLRGAEQRRLAGGFRRALFEGRSPELRSRPASRVAQGTGQRPAPTRGSPSSLATFFLAKQEESTPARKAEPSRKTRTTSAVGETPRQAEPQRETSTPFPVSKTPRKAEPPIAETKTGPTP